MTVEKKLADALRIIAAHEVAGPLTQDDNNVSLSDLPFYVAGKAHAELAILHNIARNALDAYEARPAVTGQPRFFIDHGQIHDRVTGKHITTDEDTVFCDGINHCLALLNELARRPDGFMLATHCFECDTELHGPYCPKCAALPPQGDGWQDIASAPRDGTLCLFFAPGRNKAKYIERAKRQMTVVDAFSPQWVNGKYQLPENPYTHWRPLPAPPAAELERTKGET